MKMDRRFGIEVKAGQEFSPIMHMMQRTDSNYRVAINLTKLNFFKIFVDVDGFDGVRAHRIIEVFTKRRIYLK